MIFRAPRRRVRTKRDESSPVNNPQIQRKTPVRCCSRNFDCPVRTSWLALKCSAWSPSRHSNFSSSQRYMDRSPWFLRQMAYKFLRSICPYSPHSNIRQRREVAFTRPHPVDCPVRTSRRFSKSRINGEDEPSPVKGKIPQ